MVLAEHLWPAIHAKLASRHTPLLVGLSGMQGSGKSTLARALVHAAHGAGLRALNLSLDDVYLGRAARRLLARSEHPLWITRGVPGTHDVPLLLHTLQALHDACTTDPVRLPRFDKGRDTRRPPSQWPCITQPPHLIVLEGWCLGLRPQPACRLTSPKNALERKEDSDARWRRSVNTALAGYATVWAFIDLRILLQAPNFASARRWRMQAEGVLRQRGAPHAMDNKQMRRFLQHFERLSQHALATLPRWADIRVELDATRQVRTIRVQRRSG